MRDEVSIFISHKLEDRTIACNIKYLLVDLDDSDEPVLKFFMSETDIKGGEKWYDKIRESLSNSKMLLLLFTDATKSWDWCLYEAGLFDDLKSDQDKIIICLYSCTTEPPAPLRHLKSFSSSKLDMVSFIEQIFIGKELFSLERPIASWLKKYPEKLEEAALRMSQLINRSPGHDHWRAQTDRDLSIPDYFDYDVNDESTAPPRFSPCS